MTTIDLAILLLLSFGVVMGWLRGLLKEVVSLVGFVVGLIAARLFYVPVSEAILSRVSDASSGNVLTVYLVKILIFVLIWVIVPIVLGQIASLLTHALKTVHLNGLNRLLGAAVGALKYLVLLSCVLVSMDYVGILSEQHQSESKLFRPVSQIARQLWAGREKLKTVIDEEEEKTIWIDIKHDQSDEGAQTEQ